MLSFLEICGFTWGDDKATTEYFCFLRLPIRYEELCDFLTSQVPSLKVLNKINFSDGLFLPDEKVAQFFPCSEHLDDAYHMVNINCVQHCPVNELVHMKPLVWKMVKTYNEIEFYESAEALRFAQPFIPGLQLNIAGCRYAFQIC